MSIELSESTQMCSKDNMRERERENTTIGLSVTATVAACTASSILMVVAVVLVPAMELKLAECTKISTSAWSSW